MVYPSMGVPSDDGIIRFTTNEAPLASIIIPTLDREESLARCLRSLNEQTCQSFEIILVTEKGELAQLRNKGWRSSNCEIVVFIDDDTICEPTWLSSILLAFCDESVGGVTGPAIIREEEKASRDIFKFKAVKRFYDWFFCEGKEALPGHLSVAGAWTTGASLETCSYEGEVNFLEACNSAYRLDALKAVNGFDESYRGVGDWSEPDCSLRIRNLGYTLLFTQGAKLYHEVSQSGAYASRLRDNTRYQNYRLFAKRWVKPHWKHWCYLRFLECYFLIKRLRWI